MKWVIKNPAPTDSRLKKWGDYHFGRSITKHLERAGHEVVSHYHSEWEQRVSETADVVLVLRGKYELPSTARHAGAAHVMWNISHPASVSLDEYASYDLVLVASKPWAKELAERIDTPVHALLQCTDIEEFFEPDDADPLLREGCVFVGNTRDMERPAALWAAQYGLPLQIYGRGWERFGLADRVIADYIDNERLGSLYARSRFTLNDHWDDMKEYGFINNRIFDALSCGLPVISDEHDALRHELPDEVLYFSTQTDFRRCMEEMILNYPRALERTRRGRDKVRAEFTFAARVAALIELVESKNASR